MWWICAALGFEYSTAEIPVELEPQSHADIVASVRQVLKKQGVEVTLGGEAVYLAGLSQPALVALWVASGFPREAEYDLYLPDKAGVFQPVTVLTTGSSWSLELGSAGPLAGGDINHAIQTVGLAGHLANKPWEAEVAGATARALLRLSAAERARISDVWITRTAQPTHKGPFPPSWSHSASYVVDGGVARIEVYDDAAKPTTRFVGAVDQPYHPVTAVVLHELGHAVADYPVRALITRFEQERQAYDQAVKALNEQTRALNRQIRAHNRSPTPEGASRLKVQNAAIRVAQAELEVERRRLNQATDRVSKAATGVSPVAAAYAREVGRSPTKYGESTPDEAFAEAFALYHLDRAALERAVPAAVAWFDAGSHLAVR